MQENNLFRILIVDDNPAIHQDFIKVLTERDEAVFQEMKKLLFPESGDKTILPKFIIDAANSGEEAIGLVEKSVKENNPYALAFVDMRMPPGLDGIETILRLWQYDENLQVIICTASNDYTLDEIIQKLKRIDSFIFLKKPFDMMEIRQLTYSLTKKWSLIKDLRQKLKQAE